MAFVAKNRVKETTATTGTGALTLSGAVSRFRAFSASGIPTGATFPYAIEVPSGPWEVGVSSMNADGTITRVLEDSSTGALLNLTGEAGTTVALVSAASTFGKLPFAATGAVTARSEADRAADARNLKEFGGAVDGATDDTAAVAAALAAGLPVTVPLGTAVVSTAPDSMTGRFAGDGQLKGSDGYKRGRMFARRAVVPATLGDPGDISTAFNGDMSTVQLAIEHRLDGAATATQPTTGYAYLPECSAAYLYFQNRTGWNQGTAGTTGRTEVAGFSAKIVQQGQGDAALFRLDSTVAGTKTGSTHFLANPASLIFNGSCYGFADGTYQEVDEFNHNDVGFDVAVSSSVRNFNRTNETGAKSAWWLGVRYQSIGTKAVDCAVQATGPFRRVLDACRANLDSDQGAITLAQGQRIYLRATNADAASNPRSTAVGTTYVGTNAGSGAIEVAVGGTTVATFNGNGVVLAGTPSAPTPAAGTNNTALATTAFVQGALTVATGSTFLNGVLQSGTAGGLPQVDIFTASGTWTKNPLASLVTARLIAAGGGGGGGACSSTQETPGGGGGGGGATLRPELPAASFGPTSTVTVGAAGSGGAGGTDGGNGGSGSAGGSTSMTTATGTITAYGGGAGQGGQPAFFGFNGAGGGTAGPGLGNGLEGGGGNGGTASPGSQGQTGSVNAGSWYAPGGPSGSGCQGTTASGNGSAINGTSGLPAIGAPSGAGGTIASPNGSNAATAAIDYNPGAPGGSGASSKTGNGGNAGTGSGYAAGGAGGGASCLAGASGGNGAAGRPGVVVVVQR